MHVELALIRLSYLQQAISLSHDSQGISKKKLVESAKPVALRRLPIIEFKADTQKANKQKTESQQEEIEKTGVQKVATPDNKSAPDPQPQSKLIIQEPVIPNKTKPENGSVPANPVKKTSSKGNKIGSLENIRQQIANGQGENENNKIIPLTEELLKANWEDYTKILKEKKNPASQNFELARLTITSENSFEGHPTTTWSTDLLNRKEDFCQNFCRKNLTTERLLMHSAFQKTRFIMCPLKKP